MGASQKQNVNKGVTNDRPAAKEIAIQYSQENIFNDEEPKPINGETLKDILHRSVGALTFLNIHRKRGVGSGALISENVILTAAHNIFERKLKAENTGFKFYVGADGEAEEYQEVEAWKYPPEFLTCQPDKRLSFDYAVVKLKSPIKFDKYMPLSIPCIECLLENNEKIMLEVFGFPSIYPPGHVDAGRSFKGNFLPVNPNDKYGKKFKLIQYGLASQNRIVADKNRPLKLGYGISTLPGQSGSPVVTENTIIGVHAGGQLGKEFNIGRIVDATFVKSVAEWTKQLGASSFSSVGPAKCKHNQPKSQPLQQPKPKKTNPQTKLKLDNKNLKVVDLREYGNLLELDLIYNYLVQIDLSHCPLLTSLQLSSNQLRTIDLTNSKQLTQVRIMSNKLQAIDLRANTNLTSLYLSYNQLQAIDLTGNNNLIILDLTSNKISELDLTKNTKLENMVDLRRNRLSLIRFWIAENASENIFTGKDVFDLSDQRQTTCRVQLFCEGQGQVVRKTAAKIAEVWSKKYSDKSNNQFNCKYSFKVL